MEVGRDLQFCGPTGYCRTSQLQARARWEPHRLRLSRRSLAALFLLFFALGVRQHGSRGYHLSATSTCWQSWPSSPMSTRKSRARCIMRYSLVYHEVQPGTERTRAFLPGGLTLVGASCRDSSTCANGMERGPLPGSAWGARSLLREAAVRRSPASREPHPPNACGITPAGGFSLQLRAPRCCSRACAVRSQARRLPRRAWRELSSTRRLNARLLDHNERHSLWRLPSANDFWRNQAS